MIFDTLRSFDLLDKVESVDKRGKGVINNTYIVNTYSNCYALQLIYFNN